MAERSFLEKEAPEGRCGRCKAPEPEHVNRVAEMVEPRLKREAEPDYPEDLREQGVHGSVTVRYTVSETGRVTDVSVTRSSGHAALDDSAVAAIRRFRYKPAQQDGKPRPFTLTKRFVFRLAE
jgi:TonB family protein